MLTTFIGIVVFPSIGAFLARLGLMHTYTGALLVYGATHNIFFAMTTYLAILLGKSSGEAMAITADPEILAVTSGPILVDERIQRKELKGMMFEHLKRRIVGLLLCLFIVGGAFPSIPIPALPWWIYVAVFSYLIVISNEQRTGKDDIVGPGNYFFVAVVCYLVCLYLNYRNIPLSTSLIGVAAISSYLVPYIGCEYFVEEPEGGDMYPVWNWMTIAMAAAVTWVTPGLSGSVAARAIFKHPNWMLGVGMIDLLLEGWFLGAWWFHNRISGKTMLGASLQFWTSRLKETDPDKTIYPALLVIGGLIIAIMINLVLIKLFDPIRLSPEVLQYLPYIIMIPIVVNLFITVMDPLALLMLGLLTVLVSHFCARPGMRSLVMLFVTVT